MVVLDDQTAKLRDEGEFLRGHMLGQCDVALTVANASMSRGNQFDMYLIDGAERFDDYKVHFAGGFISDLQGHLSRLVTKHRDVMELLVIGESYQRRKMAGIRISKTRTPEYAVAIMATQHGKEWPSTAAALYVVHSILHDKEHLAPLLERVEFLIIPMVNPDGYFYSAAKGIEHRYNLENIDGCVGVDLNRNWLNSFWAPAEDKRCGGRYGHGPLSSPETEVVHKVLTSRKQHGIKFLAFLDIHCCSWNRGVVLWGHPYAGKCNNNHPDAARYKRISTVLHDYLYDVTHTVPNLIVTETSASSKKSKASAVNVDEAPGGDSGDSGANGANGAPVMQKTTPPPGIPKMAAIPEEDLDNDDIWNVAGGGIGKKQEAPHHSHHHHHHKKKKKKKKKKHDRRLAEAGDDSIPILLTPLRASASFRPSVRSVNTTALDAAVPPVFPDRPGIPDDNTTLLARRALRQFDVESSCDTIWHAHEFGPVCGFVRKDPASGSSVDYGEETLQAMATFAIELRKMPHNKKACIGEYGVEPRTPEAWLAANYLVCNGREMYFGTLALVEALLAEVDEEKRSKAGNLSKGGFIQKYVPHNGKVDVDSVTESSTGSTTDEWS